jgi:FAD linked oxidases, C-terminal domain
MEVTMCFSNRSPSSSLSSRLSSALLLSVVLWAFTGIAQQPPPLQLNVPYHCANNVIVVVKHCEKRNETEFCSLVKGAANGPLGDEISLPRAQAAAIGLVCSTSGGAAQPKNATAPAASSDYTNDLPSVERVKAEIKGSDATDSRARQVAVFTYLVSYIDRIKYNRTVSGDYTPGEQKMMGAYRLAAYQMSQEYAKTHSSTEAQAFERLHGQYEMNSAFYKDWTKRLIGPQSAAAYKGAEGKQVEAINRYSKIDLPVMPTLFFEFHGMNDRDVGDRTEMLQSLAAEHGGQGFKWKANLEDMEELWGARHNAYFATHALVPGAKVLVTDVCVPISRLAECITETKHDLAKVSFQATIVGHVGDGNFHVLCVLDPNNPRQMEEGARFSEQTVQRSLEMGGTCTGEHGIGLGKMKFMQQEHGDALAVMRTIKSALDPDNRMNPGKIVDTSVR